MRGSINTWLIHIYEILIEIADQQGAVSPEKLAEEFELTQQAFFTDPEDQSAYIYHRWLLNESLAAYKAVQGTDKQAAAQKVTTMSNCLEISIQTSYFIVSLFTPDAQCFVTHEAFYGSFWDN